MPQESPRTSGPPRLASDPLPAAITDLWRALILRSYKVVYYVYDGEFFGDEIITLGKSRGLGERQMIPQVRMVKDRSAWEVTIGTRLVPGDIDNTTRIVDKWSAPKEREAYLDPTIFTDLERFKTQLGRTQSLAGDCEWTAAHFASVEAVVARDGTWAHRMTEAWKRFTSSR